jgi:polysaccharide biosynthesis/export protein
MPASDTLRIWFAATLLMGVTSDGQALRPHEKQSAIAGGYRSVPGDVLQIGVWRRSEVTRTIPVMPDGTILLPLLDNVKTSGLTAMQLAGLVHQKLESKIPNLQVTVTICQVHGPNVLAIPFVSAKPLLPNMHDLRDALTRGSTGKPCRPRRVKLA